MAVITTKVEKYDTNLNGVVKVEGKDYSFENLIKDETVEVELSKDKSKVILKRILSESKYRVKPNCSIYNKCGGCNLSGSYRDSHYQQPSAIAVRHCCD